MTRRESIPDVLTPRAARLLRRALEIRPDFVEVVEVGMRRGGEKTAGRNRAIREVEEASRAFAYVVRGADEPCRFYGSIRVDASPLTMVPGHRRLLFLRGGVGRK